MYFNYIWFDSNISTNIVNTHMMKYFTDIRMLQAARAQNIGLSQVVSDPL